MYIVADRWEDEKEFYPITDIFKTRRQARKFKKVVINRNKAMVTYSAKIFKLTEVR